MATQSSKYKLKNQTKKPSNFQNLDLAISYQFNNISQTNKKVIKCRC
ncbi:unnamed protein product [Paramecium sonneborni]|uniref:Uncharacterized protein n=1 Tax=Paramecium sonneborni TaxID=65129 RepID=A0A8S1N6Z0_9CILI|nr:unnamed protein product [Paramecium sonneborni]